METKRRLIDANVLRDDTYIFDGWDAKIVRAWLDDQPTVDAVEVVRCKDCESSRKLNNNESLYLVDECLICTNCEATDHGWNPVFPTHFCSYGERKVEDA